MKKEIVKALIEQYKNDDFDRVDIELTKDRGVGIDVTNNSIVYKESYLCVEGDGVAATIDYRIIESVVV